VLTTNRREGLKPVAVARHAMDSSRVKPAMLMGLTALAVCAVVLVSRSSPRPSQFTVHAAVFTPQSVPDVWHHAVNDRAKIRRVLRAIAPEGPVKAQLPGVEVDLRCCPHSGEVLLSHDVLPNDGSCGGKVPLAELASDILSIADASEASWRAVLKLDVKDACAGMLIVEGKIPEVDRLVRHPKVEVWGNADLVQCQRTDRDAFRRAFPSPILWGRLAAQYFPVLSIGFSRKGSLFAKPFTDADAESMRVALTALLDDNSPLITVVTGQAPKNMLRGVTLSLQLSSFRWNVPAQAAVRSMLKSADDALRERCGNNVTHHTFLTAWRGRHEWITDGDVAWLKAEFPSCTVDRG
jgi:hypothetical protein